MPYPKWFLHPPASSSSPTSTGKTSYAVLSSPSLQSTGQARATRSERRGKEGVGDSKPGSHCHVQHGEASPTSSVLSDGPGSCRETRLLSPPYPPSPSSLLSRLISHNTRATSTWGGHSLTLGTSQRSPSQARFSAAFKRDLESQSYHFSFFSRAKKE